MRNFQVKKKHFLLFCLPVSFLRFPLLSPCHFRWFNKERPQNPSSWFASHLWCILRTNGRTLHQTDIHIFTCETFAHKILLDQSHSLRNDLCKCHSHASTRSAFRSVHARVNIYGNLTVLCLARNLSDGEQITIDSLLSLS